MGIKTTLYSVDREAVVSLMETEDTNFDPQDPTELDQSLPVLSYLIGADTGRRSLYCSEGLELGDAVLRGFMPEDARMFLRRLREGVVERKLADVDWHAEIAGQVYPFAQSDAKSDGVGYIASYAATLESALASLVGRGRGMITVEA